MELLLKHDYLILSISHPFAREKSKLMSGYVSHLRIDVVQVSLVYVSVDSSVGQSVICLRAL